VDQLIVWWGVVVPTLPVLLASVAIVEEMALSQEDKPCTHCTVQQTRVRHPSVERPPHHERAAAQVPKMLCPRADSS